MKLYGHNGIEVQVRSYWSLFITEVFNPFYLFQVFSIILWSMDNYYIYAACIFILSVVSVITSLYQTKKVKKINKLRFQIINESV
jgi:cation-transporting P-type ATPase 13A2